MWVEPWVNTRGLSMLTLTSTTWLLMVAGTTGTMLATKISMFRDSFESLLLLKLLLPLACFHKVNINVFWGVVAHAGLCFLGCINVGVLEQQRFVEYHGRGN